MARVSKLSAPETFHRDGDHTAPTAGMRLMSDSTLSSPGNSGNITATSAPVVLRRVMLLVAAAAVTFQTGCQVDVGGQTLPSAYYLQDDIQYFPAGPEFKLSKEAAALKAASPVAAGDCCE